MSLSERSYRTLASGLAGRLDPVCDRFESGWLARERPRLEDFLPLVDEADRPALLRELLELELEFRGRRGEPLSVTEYRLRLPDYAADVEAVFTDRPTIRPEAPSSPPPNEPGTPLALCPVVKNEDRLSRAGRYEIEEEIARGGMGTVLRVRDPDLNRTLAVKVLQEDLRNQPEAGPRFREEAQITGQLQHPGIPPVHEVGTLPDGRPFFAMKLVKGRTLATLLKERPAPAHDRPRFLKVFEQVCQTVAYAHSNGIIHRDLKPANVMVGAFGEVQVMDWGLAKVLGRAGGEPPAAADTLSAIRTLRADSSGAETQPGSIMGTPAYMPPEQALGETDRLDRRSDVFGLGAVLCEILSGRPPYDAPDGYSALRRAARVDLADAFARLAACGADGELVGLAKRCLAAEPADRPADAGEVAVAMSAYLAGVEERLRQAERERAAAEVQAREERKRRKLAAGLAAAAGLLLCLAVGGGLLVAFERTWRAEERVARLEAENRLTLVLGHRMRGDILVELDQDDEAIAAYRQALEVMPEDTDSHFALGNVWFNKGRFDDAVAEYRETIRLNGDHVLAHHHLGDALKEKGQTDEAILAYTKAVELKPDYHEAHNDLGDALKAKGRTDDAIAAYRKAVELKPDNAIYQNDLGLALRAKGELEAAIARHREAIRLKPLVPAYHVNLGNALRNWKHPEEALEAYRKAIETGPTRASGYFGLGDALSDLQRWEEAAAEYRKGLVIDPKNAVARYNVGRALRALKRLEDAIPEYRKVAEIDPQYANAYFGLGDVLRDLKRLEEAIASYNRGLEIDPDNAAAHYNVGLALNALKRPEAALEAHRKALKINPKYALAHNGLGLALRDLKRPDEAIRSFHEASACDPQFASPHDNLGLVLFEQGRFAEAQEATRRGLELLPQADTRRPILTRRLQQCEQFPVLEKKLNAVRADQERSISDDECLGLARLCQLPFKNLYLTSARLYAAALTNNPRLADGLDQSHRYDAARSAALAAAGQGEDARLLPDKVAFGLRRQALAWLQDHAAAYGKLAERGQPTVKQTIRQRLEHWQQDPDLASVRDPEALARLPEAERQAWQQLWDDVAALLKQVTNAEASSP
jgi:serine/threonine-protein kinase